MSTQYLQYLQSPQYLQYTVHWAQLHGHVTRRKMQCVTAAATSRTSYQQSALHAAHRAVVLFSLSVRVCKKLRSGRSQVYVCRTSASVDTLDQCKCAQRAPAVWGPTVDVEIGAAAGCLCWAAAVSEPEPGWQTTPHTRRRTQHTFLEHSPHYCYSPEASLQLDCWIDLATGGSGSCKVIE